MNADIQFSRLELADTLAEVRAFNPAIKLAKAWVHKNGRDQWEFHYGLYYWHGRAGNAYDARAKGWSAYLDATRPHASDCPHWVHETCTCNVARSFRGDDEGVARG